MKICFSVSTFLSRSQTFVTTQVLHAVRAGHDVSVACREVARDTVLDAEARATLDQVRLIRWPPAPPPLLRHAPPRVADRIIARRTRAAWRRQIDADVVVAHFGYQGARIARAQAGWTDAPPLVTIYHGRDVSVEYARNGMAKYRQLFAQGALHLPVNRSFAKMLVAAGAPADRVEPLHLGVPVDRYTFAPKPLGTPLRLLSVCRLVDKKGIDVAIKALAMLRERHPEIGWTYDIGGDGPMDATLRGLVNAHGLEAHVRFLGPLSHDETLRRIAEADALLAPSVTAADGDQEGIPVTLMEAMALGTVVISSRHSGIPELVQDGVSGLLSDERDEAGLCAKLSGLVTGAWDASVLAHAARWAVEEGFAEEAQTAALMERCAAVMGERDGGMVRWRV